MEQALEALAASGPLAIVLGTAAYVLWKDNQVLRDKKDDLEKEQTEFLKSLLRDGNDD